MAFSPLLFVTNCLNRRPDLTGVLGLIDKVSLTLTIAHIAGQRAFRPITPPRGLPSVNTAPIASVANDSTAHQIVTLDRRQGNRRNIAEKEAARPVVNKASRKANRRRHIDPTTCERDYRQDEIDFMRAMDDYKRAAGRMFPTCSEVLEVVRSMGYVRLTDEQIELLGDTLIDTTELYEGDVDNDDSEACDDFE